ncbi:MAG TPA: carbohydrate ABC transporter permease, partial [Spirochaetia bacterium]|nr:carbohydrate ABC transporter permease [Spirochaetia bacterium]
SDLTAPVHEVVHPDSTHSLRRIALGRRILLYTVLSIGAFIAVLPFLYMIANSLKTYGETITRVSAIPFSPLFWPKVPQWENFQTAWQTAELSRFFVNSVVIAAITLAGLFATTIPASFAFAKLKFPGRDVIFTAMLATLIVPETVLLIPNYLIVAKLGWIDHLAALTVPFIGSAFFIFLLRQFFNQIPNTLIESARIDGSSNLRALLQIVVPLSRGPLFTMGFLAFTTSWNSLEWPLVVTQTSKWRPITVGLTTFIQEASAQIHLRMAGAVIALLPVAFVYLLAQRQITDTVMKTGMKE